MELNKLFLSEFIKWLIYKFIKTSFKGVSSPSVIMVDDTIFIFPGDAYEREKPIQRIILGQTEKY